MPEFACPDCPANFNSLVSLESHVDRLHAGDRPIERSRNSHARGAGDKRVR